MGTVGEESTLMQALWLISAKIYSIFLLAGRINSLYDSILMK